MCIRDRGRGERVRHQPGAVRDGGGLPGRRGGRRAESRRASRAPGHRRSGAAAPTARRPPGAPRPPGGQGRGRRRGRGGPRPGRIRARPRPGHGLRRGRGAPAGLPGPRAGEPAPRGRRAEPPEEKHSHGLRRLAAVEAARGSFDEAAGAVERATGDRLGKRQVEELAARTAVDFDDFYATRKLPPAADPGDVLALSADGKGIVMRPEARRPATARAAAKTSPKLATRLSKGEKRNRKRMAELGAVYDAAPVVRTPADILPD